MYVKEFGIIDIRKIFGTGAISMHTELKLVIQLSSTKNQHQYLADVDVPKAFQTETRRAQRQSGKQLEPQQNCSLTHERYKTTSILGVNIPTVALSAGRPPAILVEIAVRDLLLKAKGYFAVEEFNHRHQQFMHSYQTKNYDS